MKGLQGKFKAIRDALIEMGAVKQDATQGWQVPDSLREFIGFFVREGVSHGDVIAAIAKVMNRPLYSSAEHGETTAAGDGWFIADDILWVEDPFGKALVEKLQQHQAGKLSIKAVGYFNSGGSYQNSEDEARDTELDAILNEIIEQALESGSSDIHIFPRTVSTVDVKIRIDGDLQPIHHRVKIKDYSPFSNRVMNRVGKYGGMITEPISSKFTYKWRGRDTQIRLEVRPNTVGGERHAAFVLRLMNPNGNLRRLEEIGFNDIHYRMLTDFARRPQGLFLVTGPTGSGKTTTLYSVLQRIQDIRPRDSIQTLEDPVEVEIPGINQTAINNEAKMTFEAGLRSALRSDPDVLLVGEIRDLATARPALDAAETGHLVLATLHTNSAAATISRMLSFGLNKVQLANALIGISAQRMVSTVCPHCHEEVRFGDNPAWVKTYGDLRYAPKPDDLVAIANPEGCQKCVAGYSGRHVVSEIMMIDQATREMITSDASAIEIESVHSQNGFETLWGHGIELVKSKITTIEELESKLEPRTVSGRHYRYVDAI